MSWFSNHRIGATFRHSRFKWLPVYGVLVPMIIGVAVVASRPKLLVDFSPGVPEKWIALGGAVALIVGLSIALRSAPKAVCLLVPPMLGLNFTLFDVGIPAEEFLSSNQIGYRPWVQIFDPLALIIMTIALLLLFRAGRIRRGALIGLVPMAFYLAFLLVGLVSILAAPRPIYTAAGLFALSKFFVWYMAFYLLLVLDVTLVNFLAWGLAGLVFSQSLLGIMQALRIQTIERLFGWAPEVFLTPQGFIRVGGTLGRSNLESVMLVILPVLFAYSGDNGLPRLLRRLMAIVAVLGTVAIFLTGSRGPILATAVGIGVALRFFKLTRLRRRDVKNAFFLAIVGVLGLVILLSASEIQNTLLRDTYLFRLNSFKVALRMAADSPAIGVGLNNYLAAGPSYGMSETESQFGRPVHNQFLLATAETGFLGLAFQVLFLGSWWWVAEHGARQRCAESGRCWVVYGAKGSVVALIVTSLFDSPLIKIPVIPAFAMVVAALAAVSAFRGRD